MKNYFYKIKRLYNKRTVAYASMFWLLFQALPYRWHLLVRLAINAISFDMSIITIVSKSIVDATTSITLNWRYVIYIAGASIFTFLFSISTRIYDSYINEKFEFGIRYNLFGRVQRSVKQKLSKYHSADIVTRLSSDISNISSDLISILPSTVFWQSGY